MRRGALYSPPLLTWMATLIYLRICNISHNDEEGRVFWIFRGNFQLSISTPATQTIQIALRKGQKRDSIESDQKPFGWLQYSSEILKHQLLLLLIVIVDFKVEESVNLVIYLKAFVKPAVKYTPHLYVKVLVATFDFVNLISFRQISQTLSRFLRNLIASLQQDYYKKVTASEIWVIPGNSLFVVSFKKEILRKEFITVQTYKSRKTGFVDVWLQNMKAD